MFDNAAARNPRQLREQVPDAACKSSVAPRPPPQQAQQHISSDAHERMHPQFLIGPVKLGTRGQHVWVFEIAKGRLHAGLSAIGFHDLWRRSFAPVGNQNAQSEVVLREPPILFRITPTAHLRGRLLVALDLVTDHFAEVLAGADSLQLPSDRFRFSARCDAYFLQLLPAARQELMLSAQLSRVPLWTEDDHRIAVWPAITRLLMVHSGRIITDITPHCGFASSE